MTYRRILTDLCIPLDFNFSIMLCENYYITDNTEVGKSTKDMLLA